MSQPNFIDLFSKQSATYAQYRPLYPGEIYAWVAAQAPARDMAWDCGTGNGQAAVGLAQHFKKVCATDPSPEQIANAMPRANIEYKVGLAEESEFADRSVDLVTVALAIHWFNRDKFFAEAKRVLKPRGVLAAWAYNFMYTPNQRINDLIKQISEVSLRDYWPENVHMIWNKYNFDFPFDEIKAPDWSVKAEWSLQEFCGYVSSWSATQKYIDKNGNSPLQTIQDDLLSAWGSPENKYCFEAEIIKRVGRSL